MAARTKTKERWYEAGAPLNWHKSDSQAVRRRNALASRHGNALSTARALGALANVTTDPTTKRLAKSDSRYFYKKHSLGR